MPGENYILGGENLSWDALLELMHDVSGAVPRVLPMPELVVRWLACVYDWRASVFGWPPKITRDFVRKYQSDYFISSDNAREALGYEPVDTRTALHETLQWLKRERS